MSDGNSSQRSSPRFSGVKTFFRLPYEKAEETDKKLVICGVPFDGGTTYRSGARMAPASVREVSALGRGWHMKDRRNVFEKLDVVDGGDLPTNPISLQKTYEMLEQSVLKLAGQKKRILSVGGDHSITLPLLRALSKVHGPLNLIHFDAHFDSFPPAYGEDYHHGTFVRHAVEEKRLSRIWQLGIRGPLTTGEDMDFVKKHKISFSTVEDIKDQSESFLSNLSQTFSGPTYLSFDVDCLDPAFAPGTGTPMPGGLSTYEMQRIFHQLKVDHLVGADFVELNPSYDSGQISALATVSALFETLNLMAGN